MITRLKSREGFVWWYIRLFRWVLIVSRFGLRVVRR